MKKIFVELLKTSKGRFGRKGAYTALLFVAVILIIAALFILPVKALFTSFTVSKEYLQLVADDLANYIISLSTVDRGIKHYGFNAPLDVEFTKDNITVRYGNEEVAKEHGVSLISENSFKTAVGVCIVKSDTITVCNSTDSQCCSVD